MRNCMSQLSLKRYPNPTLPPTRVHLVAGGGCLWDLIGNPEVHGTIPRSARGGHDNESVQRRFGNNVVQPGNQQSLHRRHQGPKPVGKPRSSSRPRVVGQGRGERVSAALESRHAPQSGRREPRTRRTRHPGCHDRHSSGYNMVNTRNTEQFVSRQRPVVF